MSPTTPIRLAKPQTEAEAKEFDRIRARFVEEAARHMDRGQGIEALARDPDHFFLSFMETIVAANRDGQPVPAHLDWFTRFCTREMDMDDGMLPRPAEPTVN